ncbi:MAG TPA: hypothetical protein VFF65_06005 [Phycisphaerales bacterium]|nr:hypothetical protein [Phycisphaerales bacterium]
MVTADAVHSRQQRRPAAIMTTDHATCWQVVLTSATASSVLGGALVWPTLVRANAVGVSERRGASVGVTDLAPNRVEHRLRLLQRQPGISDDEAFRRLLEEAAHGTTRTQDGLRWYFDGRFWWSEPVV